MIKQFLIVSTILFSTLSAQYFTLSDENLDFVMF